MALGEVDYGLYGVVGGLTAFIGFFLEYCLVRWDAFMRLQLVGRELGTVPKGSSWGLVVGC